MKNLLKIFALILLPGIVFAQEGENRLTGNARVKGGFGGPFFVYSQVENHNGNGGGGGGAIIINEFFFGGFGQGETFGQHLVEGLNYDLNLSQGGIWVGYVRPSKQLVHGFGSFKFGFGEVMLKRNPLDGELLEGKDIKDNISVISPEIGAEINIAPWVRLAVTGGYRWVTGVDKLPYFTESDFQSPIFGITLRFGNFGYKKKE